MPFPTDNITIINTISTPYTFYDFLFKLPLWELDLIFIGIAAILSITVYLYFGNVFASLCASLFSLGISASMGLIPLWIPLLMGVFGVGIILIQPTDEKIPEGANPTDYWDAYGQRLKDAYTAKFGGENKGFNQEIDSRILIMKKCRRGFTNTIARDYLRRMRNFTESK